MTDFPESIKATGTGLEEEFLFLSKVIEGKKTTHVLMRAKKDKVESVPNPDVAKGMSLPVYIRPWETYITAGQMMEMA